MALALLTVIVFLPVRHFDFVNYDDLEFVVENPHVSEGLTGANIRWAFEHPYVAAGGPLTWLSHMLDVEMFGMNAGGHHLTSLVIHTVNAVLLWLLLWNATGAAGRSALVAALFAVHPLHVESVAWVAERKDVLSTFFWILTTGAYLRFTRRTNIARYLLVVLLFVCGLAAKPMVATLPAVLLVLDAWPLRRAPLLFSEWRRWVELLVEKIPLIILAAVALALTYVEQRDLGAVSLGEALPLPVRLANAAVSPIAYIGKMLWPSALVPFYPFRSQVPLSTVAMALAALGAVTWTVVAARRRAPYLLTGWSWFLVSLIPVLGIVQVGGHAMADRFTYIPLIGLFVAASWGSLDMLTRLGVARRTASVCALIVISACALTARTQVRHWQNGITLWEHAVSIDPANARAQGNLGVALMSAGRSDEAIAHYDAALQLQPDDSHAHNNLALVLAARGRSEEALAHYFEAVRLNPEYVTARIHLANLLDEQGRSTEAIPQYLEALRLNPSAALARGNLAIALARSGDLTAAIAHMEQTARDEPGNPRWQQLLEMMRRDRQSR